MNYTIKKNQTIYKILDDKELFLISKGCDDYEQYSQLIELLQEIDISYKYLGFKNQDGGDWHYYQVYIVRGNKKVLQFRYIGNTDHSDNPLTIYDILYEIVERATSDPSNPLWTIDKRYIKKIKDVFSDKEISLFPSEIVEHER